MFFNLTIHIFIYDQIYVNVRPHPMWYIVLAVLLIGYLVYGISNVVKDKSLNRIQKVVWIIIAIWLPFLGVALYFRSTFKARE